MPRRKPVGPQRDPAAVQAEIEQVQQRLAASIDELVERTHPKNVAKRGLAKVRHAGSQLVEEARAIASGNPVRRKSSRFVEPPEGSILVSGEDEVVTEYELRQPPSPALLVGVGVGVVVAVGVLVLLRRRSKR
ncbi:hypothetical protein JCM3263A_03170 [Thermobifida fusca]|jgi:hypothetical protein|uniref:DUF3618 domain-containing protein n=1 Tax=Thermobifida fusca (strain YX) TaxID=269800 RepID=Q47MD1_THEFY|nr:MULTISPECIES: DUF3618 domain-containing protein [Thermobifida]AAZ56391.1 hypothetical protein Tfu_2358 [Thermobifida fusca YX]MBO2531140.1 DUF3618 domain-containing protein [Thermobifida sp.]MDD6791634.1 DUF3618 domain-containing protein [Thermobifida fusca]PPS91518.1 hypothetical protein BH05_14720 [Thermobifida fusca]PZN63340.1 MAG: DUF3618 domain-containing protein [Thermobifida fusca]